jgi:hypothetical protein
VDLPFDWQGAKGFAESAAGSVQLKDTRVRYLKLDTPAWPITLNGHLVTLAVKLASDPAAVAIKFTPQFEMQTHKLQGDYELAIPDLSKASGLIGDLLPDLSIGLPTLKGTLTISGKAGWGADTGITGDLVTKLRDCDITMTAPAVAVSKIDLDLALTQLWPPRSGAMQRLTFGDTMAVGVPVEKGLLEFQIESLDSILVERLELGWCGGQLAAHALRLDPHKLDFDLTLYADKIQLGKVLGLFYGFKGSGEGILYGKLPISFINGRISYRDGFLYSVPGRPGFIRLKEWAYLDTLKKALKNFRYDFFTMDLEGEGSETSIKLRLFGRSPDAPSLQPFDFKTNISGHLKEVINASIGFSKLRGMLQ